MSTGTIKVPDVAGKTEADARKILTDAGFTDGQIRSENVENTTVPVGTVLGTDPRVGSAVGAGEDITLQIAAAAETITVPDVTGQPEALARQNLQSAGFTNVVVEHGGDEGVPGTAASTTPAAGTKVAPDTEILLVING